MAKAHAILDELEKGRDPFDAMHGDFHKAYRSMADQTWQPYRLFVPSIHDGTQRVPLLIALHGAGGDENDMFDGFSGASLTDEAERVGLLVVCPRGRPASGFREAGEHDIFDTEAEVQRDYKVDPDRIYLMGHSMGAAAVWRLAMAYPDRFAAIAAIAGSGHPAGAAGIRHLPQYVIHGAEDQTVPVAASRAMAEAAAKLGAPMVYIEVPGAGHFDVVRGQFGPMLDFLAKQSRRK